MKRGSEDKDADPEREEFWGYPNRYLTRDDAAMGWAAIFGAQGLENSLEYGSSIYSYKEQGTVFFGFNNPASGWSDEKGDHVTWNQSLSAGAVLEGVIHNHYGKKMGTLFPILGIGFQKEMCK